MVNIAPIKMVMIGDAFLVFYPHHPGFADDFPTVKSRSRRPGFFFSGKIIDIVGLPDRQIHRMTWVCMSNPATPMVCDGLSSCSLFDKIELFLAWSVFPHLPGEGL